MSAVETLLQLTGPLESLLPCFAKAPHPWIRLCIGPTYFVPHVLDIRSPLSPVPVEGTSVPPWMPDWYVSKLLE